VEGGDVGGAGAGVGEEDEGDVGEAGEGG
jgi:hypothetical protein